MTKKKKNKILIYILLLFVAALVVLPFLWMVVSAFKSQRELFAYPPTFFPTEWKFENFTEAASRGSISFAAMFVNSMKIAVPSTVFNIIFSSLAGYAFARLRFPHRDKIFMGFLAAMMVPFVVTLVPRFLMFRDLGFYDTYVPLIVPAMFGTPFSVFLTRQFFMTLPKELEEAAMIDGCTLWGIYFRIFLPLLAPVTATCCIRTGIGIWNDYLVSATFLNSAKMPTIMVSVNKFFGEYVNEYGQSFAAVIMCSIPALILFLSLQKYFIKGIVAGSVKS